MSVRENVQAIRERIWNAEIKAGKTRDSVKLMAVSKFHPASSILEAIEAGLDLFGENRVQEATDKFPAILEQFPETNLHLIGTLQRNKVKQIIRTASCIQSVDRAELLQEIGKQADDAGKIIDILFEFHTGEDSKSGYQDRDSLYRSIELLSGLRSIRCKGLMTMAPFTKDTSIIRKSFRSLVSVQSDCQKRFSTLDFSVLSMGMSSDFEIAIDEGSTLVRVGTAIFGERP